MEKIEMNRENQSEVLRYDDLIAVVVIGDRYVMKPKDSHLPSDSLPICTPTLAAFMAEDWEFFKNEYHLALQKGSI